MQNQQLRSFRTYTRNLVKKVMHLWFGLTVDITSPALNGKYFQFPSRAEISIFLEAQCILGGAKGDSGLPSGLGLPAAKIALDFHRLHKFCVFCGSPSVPPMPRVQEGSEWVPLGSGAQSLPWQEWDWHWGAQGLPALHWQQQCNLSWAIFPELLGNKLCIILKMLSWNN